MTLKPLQVLPLCWLIGCMAAPREVETVIELGPKTVEIDVRLRDIRTAGTDDLTQFRVFNEFASWDPEWINDVPWAPTPTRFEYLADAGRLDLAMHGSMSRADFDWCARAASDAGVCNDLGRGLILITRPFPSVVSIGCAFRQPAGGSRLARFPRESLGKCSG